MKKKNVRFRRLLASALAVISLLGTVASASAMNVQNKWLVQTGTALSTVGANCDFAGYADWNGDGAEDLWMVKKNNCGTRKTELHILDGTNHNRFLFQAGTGLGEVPNNQFQFCVGDYNGDGRDDLICIKVRETGTRTTEVHVLSGASNFQTFLLHTGTRVEEGKENWEFLADDWNGDGRADLIGVKRDNGRGKTEVHILNGGSGYQNFLLQTQTALHSTGENWQFVTGDFDTDGQVDLCAISDANTGSKTTELHILSGTSGFTKFCLNSASILGCAAGTLKFLDTQRGGFHCVAGIKTQNTGTGKTEAHIMSVSPVAKSAVQNGGSVPALVPVPKPATQPSGVLRMPLDQAKCSWRDGGAQMSWGERNGSGARSYHAGLDLKSAVGSTTVRAFADGVVVETGRNGTGANGNGCYITLEHTLPSGQKVYSFYGHLAGVPGLAKGARVSAGQQIGTMGSTGRSSGPHLHFALANRVVWGGGYAGYVTAGSFSGDRNTAAYNGTVYYNPLYVIQNGRLL